MGSFSIDTLPMPNEGNEVTFTVKINEHLKMLLRSLWSLFLDNFY